MNARLRAARSLVAISVERREMLKRNLALGALILLLGFLSVYPLSMLFYGSIFSSPPGTPGDFNLDGYRDLVSPENLIVLWNTLSIAEVKGKSTRTCLRPA